MVEEEYDSIDLREMFYILKTNILTIGISTVICALIGFLFTTLFITPMYQASATMIVNNRADQAAVVTYDQINSAKQLIGTYSIILKSDTVLDQVIKNLKLNTMKGLEDIDAIKLAEIVEVVGVDTTQAIRVSVKQPNGEVARAIVEEIVKLAPNAIVSTVKAGSVELISAPRAFEKPVSPNKKLNTAVAALIGMVFSIGFVVLKELFNNTIKSDTDIQKHFELMVLGVIPRIEIDE